jgi:hypothetical protein
MGENFEYIINRERIPKVILFKNIYESRLKRAGGRTKEETIQKNPKRLFKSSKIQIPYTNDNSNHVSTH